MFFGPPAGGSAANPQKTLQSFVTALNRRDRRTLELLVHNSKSNPALDVAFREEKEKPTILSASRVHLKKLSSNRVMVQYLLGAVSPEGKSMKPVPEELEMIQVGGNWLIVAPRPDANPEPGNLGTVATVLAYPEMLQRANDLGKALQARTNLKLLTNAAFIHMANNEDKIVFKSEDYVKQLGAYAKNPAVFTSPLDQPHTISFLFNGNLTGREHGSLGNPEKTIFFFEGKPVMLNFRYDGKALVALCDGNVKFVTPAEAKALLWK